MSTVKTHSNGHDYLEIDSFLKIRADSETADFIKRQAKQISYDSCNDILKYRCSRGSDTGRNTTLARRIYCSFKAHKPLDEVKTVRFKNGNHNDFRLANLTTRK